MIRQVFQKRTTLLIPQRQHSIRQSFAANLTYLYGRGVPIQFENLEVNWSEHAEYLQTGAMVETVE